MKILLKILYNKIYPNCQESLRDTQFDFHNGLGIKEALLSLEMLIQRCYVSVDAFIYFINYEKAFVKLQHNNLIKILEKTAIDNTHIHFQNQTVTGCVDNNHKKSVEILCGVRQDCVCQLSYIIFKQKKFCEKLLSMGISVVNQTEWMEISEIPRDAENLAVKTERIERVSTYLGNVHNHRDMNILLGLKLLRCFVFAMYRTEAWTPTEAMSMKYGYTEKCQESPGRTKLKTELW